MLKTFLLKQLHLAKTAYLDPFAASVLGLHFITTNMMQMSCSCFRLNTNISSLFCSVLQ